MTPLATDHVIAGEGLVICVLIVLLVAAAVYAVVTYGFKQPHWGAIGGTVIAIVGALLCLL
jgi:membrane protein YdbS with pleckstrin-like domain